MKPSNSRAVEDLGPLAWVLDEVKKSVSSATKSLRRYVRDAEAARGSDLASVDANALRVARQQIHQACGALEMVGQAGPNLLLKAMEEVVQHAVQKPELCTDSTVDLIERCGFALTEYLERAANGKAVEPVELFSHYRDARSRVGAHRIHPADLWSHPWRWADPAVDPMPSAVPMDAAFRGRMDQLVLRFVRTGDGGASRDLVSQCLTIAAGAQDRQSVAFWKIAAGFFEAIAEGLLSADVYVKRIASRILLQAAMTARGDSAVADQLGRDLLFFCANASVPTQVSANTLRAVRRAFGLESHATIRYESSPYGKFDPTLLTQAGKRIASAKELWTAVVSGEADRSKAAVDQFSMVADSLLRLSPITEALATALQTAAQVGVAGGQTPTPELAMEVATAVLFVESVLTDFRPETPEFAQRTLRIAQRLNAVAGGNAPESLDVWIEELYRQVSDQQTIGSVVGELKAALGELESALDQFFRNPNDKISLKLAPALLTQIRGVLSVLGLNSAVKAIQALRERVDNYLVTDVNAEHGRASGNFDRIGNTLGVLSFLLDMLNYQPALVKKLFSYDEETGELQYVMRRGDSVQDSQSELLNEDIFGSGLSFELADGSPDLDVSSLGQSLNAVTPAVAQAPVVTDAIAAQLVDPISAGIQDDPLDDGDLEILDIFLEEAGEVVVNGRAALTALERSHTDWAQLTTLRRAFHTLKGSSRMVGLDQFGEAGWSMEQLLNAWLSDNRPANADLLGLCAQAFDAFEAWVGDIRGKRIPQWSQEPFRRAADALRLEGRRVSLAQDVSVGLPAAPPSEEPSLLWVDDDVANVQADAPSLTPIAVEEMFAEPLSPDLAPGVVAIELPSQLDQSMTDDFFMQDALTAPVAADVSDAAVPIGEPESVVDLEFAPELDLTLAELDALFEFESPAGSGSGSGSGSDSVSADLVPAVEGVIPDPVLDVAITDANVDAPADAGLDFDFGSVAKSFSTNSSPSHINEVDEGFDVFAFNSEPTPGVQVATSASHLMLVGGSDLTPDDQTKVIGELRLPIPLYNVFLNEADEWSRQLQVLMSELVLAPEMGVPGDSVVYAHSLAGSSATVGFQVLSALAREMEHALMHLELVRSIPGIATQSLQRAADEIRRLLHQFAAGFLKTVDAGLMDDLRAIQSVEASDSAWPDDDFDPNGEVATPIVEVFVEDIDESLISPNRLSAASLPLIAAVSEPVHSSIVVAAPASGAYGVRATDLDFDDGEDLDDALDVTDAVDPDLFPIFEEEAIDLLPRLGASLRQWVQQPDNDDWRVEALRVLHTLKGSARLAGAMRMGEAAHRLESLIERLPREQLQSAEIEPLLARGDALDAMLRKLADEPRLASAVLQEAVDAPVGDEIPVLDSAPDGIGALLEQHGGDASEAVAQPAPLVLSTIRSASQQMVRVRSGLLDRLVGQAGEVMITRSRLDGNLIQMRVALGELTANLEKLRRQLRDVELQAEVQMQSRLAQSRDIDQGFDPLEFDRFTRVQELTRMMAESVNDVATVQRTLERSIDASEGDLAGQMRQTRELQRDLLRTRMVEFESISERLYRVVRLAAKDSGKQVRLDITGGSIEMDRGVLERMAPAFEHLLRNGVGHGIEAPGVREAAGKSPFGTIAIDLRQEGNEVLVEFRDDGAGLDLDRIRQRALERGLMKPDADVKPAELAQMIFEPGFSTAEQVTELSGRGIGMDVVRSEVTSLGGRIEIASQTAQGSRFGLHLPLTTAVTQIVLVRAGNVSVGAPATVVELVLRYSAAQLERAYRDGSVVYGGETIPFHWVGALLQASGQSQEPAGKTSAVVVFRSASQRVAVHVDDVLGNQEVVIKKLGAQLVRLPGLSGMTALASGAVILIYNPVALAAVYGERARRMVSQVLSAKDAVAAAGQERGSDVTGSGAPVFSHASMLTQALTGVQDGPSAAMQPVVGLAPLVLVVDDSVTVRRVSQRLLLREGYRVTLASDGLQAIEKLAEERPALVLSDIEMPRMDGFDLVRNIRQDASLAGMPVIMITSRIAEKHREHARELGVNHYLGKPFVEDDLMRLVRQYAQPNAVELLHT